MNRLARYIAWEVALYTFFTLVALTGLFVFFGLLNELDEVGKGGYRFIDVALHVLLEMPKFTYELLPVSSLIGGIYALSMLSGHSELTVMRVSGVSILRLTGWLATLGLIFALLTALLGEYIAPAASRAASRHKIEATKQVMVGNFQSGIWIKDGRQIANIGGMLPDLTLQDVRIYDFDASQKLTRITEGRHAVYDKAMGTWQLQKNTITEFATDQSRVSLSYPEKQSWKTDVNPDMLAVLMVKPKEMSMRALARYIAHLNENGQNAARYQLSLWTKIFYPIACISMMLIALPFALLQKRSGGIGMRIFIGILLGVGFNFLNQIMGHLGALYSLPAPLAAALPTLLLLGGATVVLWRQSKS